MSRAPAMPSEAVRALLFVTAYRAKHGHGPTWRELRLAMGWTRRQGQERIRALYPYGLRWRRGVERFLDVSPRARRALVEIARQGRAEPR